MEDGKKTIRRLRITIKASFAFFVLFFVYILASCHASKFYCFGVGIDLAIPFIVVGTSLGISIFIFYKKRLPIRILIDDFSKVLVTSLVALFVAMIFLGANCFDPPRERAFAARRTADLEEIYNMQKGFYEQNSRYAVSLEELGPFWAKEAKQYNIIFEGGKDSSGWRAYAYINEDMREICNTRKLKDVFICDENGCRQEKAFK